MKIRPLGTELFHADRRTDRHDEANSSFSQFLRTRLKSSLGDFQKPGLAKSHSRHYSQPHDCKKWLIAFSQAYCLGECNWVGSSIKLLPPRGISTVLHIGAVDNCFVVNGSIQLPLFLESNDAACCRLHAGGRRVTELSPALFNKL